MSVQMFVLINRIVWVVVIILRNERDASTEQNGSVTLQHVNSCIARRIYVTRVVLHATVSAKMAY